MNFSDKTYLYYINKINKVPLLTRKEEYDLAIKAKHGDQDAKDQIILANLRFVIKIARRYSSCGLSLMDLVSEGNLGLMRAVESFEADKGYHFISYAVHWIKQSIIKAISEKSKIIRIPLHLNNTYTQINKNISQDYKNDLTHRNLEDLSKKMNMNQNEMHKLIAISKGYTSIDKQIDNGDGSQNSKQLKDIIEDTGDKTPETCVVESGLKNDIKVLLSQLSETEADVITYRFGLENKTPLTLQEIGKIKNVTKERIRQIEKKALGRLKEISESNYLKTYLE